MKKTGIVFLCAVMVLFLFAGTVCAQDEREPITSGDLQIIQTGIEADSVANHDGYGDIRIFGKQNNETGNYDNQQYALIDKSGEFIFDYKEHKGSMYSRDFYYVYSDGYVLDANGNSGCQYSWGTDVYNLSGEKPFKPEYMLADYHFEEEDDETLVCKKKHRYTFLTPFCDGTAIVCEEVDLSILGQGWGGGTGVARIHFIDKDGKIINSFSADDGIGKDLQFARHAVVMAGYWNYTWPSEGLIGITTSIKVSEDPNVPEYKATTIYVDYSGNKIISLPGYINSGMFSEGLAFVNNGSGCGYIDKNGKEVIPCIYEDNNSFHNGLAAVKKDGKWGYINACGEILIPFEYDDAFGAGNGLAAVGKEGKYGLIDYQNHEVVPLEYDDISSFDGGVAYAIKDGKISIITLKETPEPPVQVFSDVQDKTAWFYDTVYAIAGTVNKNGTPLMSGYKDGSNRFGPANPLTRQDFAVILYRLADEPDAKSPQNPFLDADKNGYYYPSLLWAKENKVITGYDNGMFGVGDKITREQVATILYRYAKEYKKLDVKAAYRKGNLSKFSDSGSVSLFAEEALAWASGAGIITGKENGTMIDPQGNAARAEIGAMILRFIGYEIDMEK